MASFKSLTVWQRAHRLAIHVYRATGSFPDAERFGLVAQLRRAASSIGANLAEGCGRHGDPELRRYARIARGSCSEVESHLLLARDLGYLSGQEWQDLNAQVCLIGRELTGLVRALSR